jgi:hypothetical protein
MKEIDGWFSGPEAELLRKAVEAAPKDVPLVEVGVYLGRSASVLAEGQGGRWLWLYDDMSMIPESMYGLEDLELKHAYTADWPKGEKTVWRFMDPADDPQFPVRTGLIHQDADHSYEVVRKHLQALGPTVVPGGFIVLHDYHCDTYKGVRAAWCDWAGSEDFEEWDRVDSLQVFRRTA